MTDGAKMIGQAAYLPLPAAPRNRQDILHVLGLRPWRVTVS